MCVLSRLTFSLSIDFTLLWKDEEGAYNKSLVLRRKLFETQGRFKLCATRICTFGSKCYNEILLNIKLLLLLSMKKIKPFYGVYENQESKAGWRDGCFQKKKWSLCCKNNQQQSDIVHCAPIITISVFKSVSVVFCRKLV